LGYFVFKLEGYSIQFKRMAALLWQAIDLFIRQDEVDLLRIDTGVPFASTSWLCATQSHSEEAFSIPFANGLIRDRYLSYL
jgi:hypothetical protein